LIIAEVIVIEPGGGILILNSCLK